MNDLRKFPRTWHQEKRELRDSRMWWPVGISWEFQKDREREIREKTFKDTMAEKFS